MAEKEFIERGAVSKKIDALEVPVFYADGNLDCYQEGFKDALKQVVEILENHYPLPMCRRSGTESG